MSFSIQSEDDLDHQINGAGEKLIVIDFFADWCVPCKNISPKLEELAALYSEKVLVLKVNVELNEEISSKFKITSLPTFVFLKDEEVLEVFVGANLDKIEKSVHKYISDGAMLEQQEEMPQDEQPEAAVTLSESEELLYQQQQQQQELEELPESQQPQTNEEDPVSYEEVEERSG